MKVTLSIEDDGQITSYSREIPNVMAQELAMLAEAAAQKNHQPINIAMMFCTLSAAGMDMALKLYAARRIKAVSEEIELFMV